MVPKKGSSKSAAYFTTHFGSIDNCFIPFGETQYISVPDGVAHFLEHKMFEMPNGIDASNLFLDLGADSNAYTDYNETAYVVSCTSNFNKVLELLLDFVQTPFFTDENVEKEKGIICEEGKMGKNNPGHKLYYGMNEALYKKDKRRNLVTGEVDDVKGINVSDSLLSGIPYGVKDNYSTKAILTTGSSNTLKDYIPFFDATAIENANANVDEKSFSGREKEASSDIQKIIALDYTLSPEVANAHRGMLLYQHDMEKTNIGEHNCLFVDFKKIFNDGFVTRNGDVRPPSKYDTACQQYAVIFQCQSQVQFGGVGTVHADYDLAPFVTKSFRKHMRNYLTDVEDQSLENAEIILKQHGPINMDNQELKKAMPAAFAYAMKQMEREGTQASLRRRDFRDRRMRNLIQMSHHL